MICSMRTLPQISDNQTPSSNPEASSLLLCRFSFLQVPGSFSLSWSFEAFFSQFFLFDLFSLCMLFYIYRFSIYLFIYFILLFALCVFFYMGLVLLYYYFIIIIIIIIIYLFLVFGFICLKRFLLLLLVLSQSNNSMSLRSNSQEKWN